MKLIIQRVAKAELSVRDSLVSRIGLGLFVLVGIHPGDSLQKAEKAAEKLAKMRIMSDEFQKMNKTVKEVSGEFLIVSQFTLYADTKGGNRPSFINAARPEIAEPIYDHLVKRLKDSGEKVATGRFGEYMKIDVILDGPVTIILES